MAPNSECKVYAYRLYDVQPSAILCLKYDEKTQFLAVSRENGSIEIWRHYENRCWDQFGFIPAEPEERRVDNLEWTKYGHLLSTGIDGLINQYDIKTLMVSLYKFVFCKRMIEKTNSSFPDRFIFVKISKALEFSPKKTRI